MLWRKIAFLHICECIRIYSVCSQIQLLGTLINFILQWQKVFFTWNSQTHCRLQKQAHKLVIQVFYIPTCKSTYIFDLSLIIYAATLSQVQTRQSHSTTITGGATTPEMPPIFKQKSKVKFTNYPKIHFTLNSCSIWMALWCMSSTETIYFTDSKLRLPLICWLDLATSMGGL